MLIFSGDWDYYASFYCWPYQRCCHFHLDGNWWCSFELIFCPLFTLAFSWKFDGIVWGWARVYISLQSYNPVVPPYPRLLFPWLQLTCCQPQSEILWTVRYFVSIWAYACIFYYIVIQLLIIVNFFWCLIHKLNLIIGMYVGKDIEGSVGFAVLGIH